MKITAYPLYGPAASLQPSPEGRGWDFLCPCAFEAVWHGGPGAGDVEIRLADRLGRSSSGSVPGEVGFVQSREGEGLLTFYPGYQCKTEAEHALWVRGPINASKDGAVALESVIDTSILPGILSLHWRLTRPGQILRFEAGEPFCTIVPYPRAGLDEVTVEVVPLTGGMDDYERALQSLTESRALESVFERLSAGNIAGNIAGNTAGKTARDTAVGAPPNEKRRAIAEIPFPPPFHVIPPPPPGEPAERLFRGVSSMGDYALKVSVVLPATNESVLLERTVEQFVATLPANSEVIVVDNGSTDGCADFLAEGKWENVHLIRSIEPLGVSAARNRGLAEARGEVVVFSDAHMDVPERWWEPLVRTLNLPHVGVAAPGIGVMGRPDLRPACGQRIVDNTLRLEWLSPESAEPRPVPTLGGGCMAMRRETLERAGAFDEGMPQWGSEDLELCVRYWLLGYEAWVVPEVTVLHYFRNARPYGVQWHLLTHNLLRVALLHFNRQRISRVTAALRNRARFGVALAHAVESDVWQKRAEFEARRVRDDDWLFERFKESCHV